MISKYSLFLVLSVIVFCNSGFVLFSTKCYIEDKECTENMLQRIFKEKAESGIPDIGIPPFDPFSLNDVTVKVLELFKITLIEGTAKGLKGCSTDKYVWDLKKGRTLMDITCDVEIEGKYKVFSTNPAIREFLKGFGGPSGEGALTVDGEGYGKVDIKKLTMKVEFFFNLVRRDGQVYIKNIPKKTKYEYDIGEVRFAFDKIYLGGVESSKYITQLLDENWKFFASLFGKPFADKAVSITLSYVNKLFNHVPCEEYFLDDFSQYVK